MRKTPYINFWPTHTQMRENWNSWERKPMLGQQQEAREAWSPLNKMSGKDKVTSRSHKAHKNQDTREQQTQKPTW